MEYTCEDCTESFNSLVELAEHCRATGHYDEEASQLDLEATQQ